MEVFKISLKNYLFNYIIFRKEEDERYSPAPGRKNLDQGELSNQSSYTDIQALERPKKKSSYVNVREAEKLKPQPQSKWDRFLCRILVSFIDNCHTSSYKM